MRLALSTGCLSGTLRDKLERAAAARFDAVELCESDFIGFPGTAREVRQIADDLGIGIDLYQPMRDIARPEASVQQARGRAERKFDLMGQLGVPLLSVMPTTLPIAWAQPTLAAEQLRQFAELAASRNLRLALAPGSGQSSVGSIREAWAIVVRADHPHLGLLIDSARDLSASEDVRDIPGQRIFFARVGDARRYTGYGSRDGWVRNFPGQGDLDLVGFLETVLVAGYAGPLSLANTSDGLGATTNQRTATDARRSLLYLESQLRAHLERAGAESTGQAAARRILDSVALFDPPEPSPLNGFAFIEFGVRDDAGARLEARLQQLGFTRYGRHRTKAVSLYRQGDIRIAINAEGERDTLGRFADRPAYISSVGLLAENPGRAVSRAGAMLSARHDTPRGAHDIELPTIIAPGGTMIQFLAHDQPAEADFIEDPSGTAHSFGLDVVDHVAMSLTYEQRDTWLLFARAVLGLTPSDPAEGSAPVDIIRGIGLATNNRRVRFLLNASIAQSAGLRGASEAGASNGGIDSLAFGCTDIFATVERLRDNGVSFVPISRNYYDDLAGRTTLDDSTVDRMRELQIMFDDSGGGTYFHAYTESFEDGFHFQVVQRTGYEGFGAVNEPIRSAAVAQLRQFEAWLKPRL